MKRWHVWDPKYLTVDLNASQTTLRQVFFFQTKKREVWQIAEDGLKPTMLGHDLADARIIKLVDVERQHRDGLRSSRCGNGIKNRLRQVIAEVNTTHVQL